VPRPPNIFFYKLTADDGGAPCVSRGLLSLAICKPMIRSKAVEGDLVFGFSATSQHRDNRLLYIARVTKKESKGAYYQLHRYARRDDCIYRYNGKRLVRRPGALYHGSRKALTHDVGPPPEHRRANVLLSNDFRYFGKNGSADYKRRFLMIKRAVEELRQGHRRNHKKGVRAELLELAKLVWSQHPKEMELGSPTKPPSRNSCHRSRSCGEC
jgi:hypothetical protein